jgi:hypothetical protein
MALSTNRHGVLLDAVCFPLHCARLPSCPGMICFCSSRKLVAVTSKRRMTIQRRLLRVCVCCVCRFQNICSMSQKRFPSEQHARSAMIPADGRTDRTIKLRCSSKSTCLHRVWMAMKCRIRSKVKADIVSAVRFSAATYAAMAATVCADNIRDPPGTSQWR